MVPPQIPGFHQNVFVILGLRPLYFRAGRIHQHISLPQACALPYNTPAGVKMLAAKWLKAWLGDSFDLTVLDVLPAIFATGIITSMIVGAKDEFEANPSNPK